ncbi:MAG: arylsulfatase A-like enzyme [Planctomycetota bacterium]
MRCADTAAAAAWTKPATGTILTGLFPSRHGALYHGSRLRLPEGEQTMAEAFRDAGYVTAGFVTNPNIKRAFGFDRGFTEFFDSPVEDTVTLAALRGALIGRIATDLLRHQFNWKYENDVRTMNGHVFGWLEQNHSSPFFLYVHYIDPHIPYSPPEPYLSDFSRDLDGLLLFNERKEQVGIDRYDGEIRYVDEGLRELVAELKRLDAWENTLFVLTSDHGEEFFEHGVLGHGYSLYQPVIGVPLLFHGPEVEAGTVIEEPVQIVDLPATVLDLAQTGVSTLGDGKSFAARVRGESDASTEVLFLENEFGMGHNNNREFVLKGVRKGRWKLVITEANAFFSSDAPEAAPLALYDLEADPLESNNLFHLEVNRPIVTELKELLDEHLLFLQENGFRDAAPMAISEDVQRSLDALGY